MKTNHYFYIFSFSFIFLLSSCVDIPEDDVVVPIDDPEIFSCKIDGVEWMPEQSEEWSPNQFQYYEDTRFMELFAQKHSDEESISQSIAFDAKPIALGENKIKFRRGIFKDWLNEGNCIGYNLDTLQPHIIDVEILDLENRRIQGTFLFTAYDEDCDQSVEITEGKFRFNF